MDDAFQIQQLINAYHEAGSTADYERMIATYAPDGVWEFTSTGNKFVGLAAIRASSPIPSGSTCAASSGRT